MKEQLKLLFKDKQVIAVFGMCTLMHIFIFWKFQLFFSMPLGAIILIISLIDIGATLCILEAIKKFKKCKVGRLMIEMMTYTILKGEHYCNNRGFRLYTGKKVHEDLFMFDNTAPYDITDTNDQTAINKMFGNSFGNQETHSIRAGWNYNLFTKSVDVHWYVHENGVVKNGYVGSCKLWTIYKLRREYDFSKNSFTFMLMEYRSATQRVTHVINSVANVATVPFKYPFMKIGYYLYFYFGGQRTATHDTNLHTTYNP